MFYSCTVAPPPLLIYIQLIILHALHMYAFLSVIKCYSCQDVNHLIHVGGVEYCDS